MAIKNEPYVDELIQRQKKVIKPTDLRLKVERKKKKKKLAILRADQIKNEPLDSSYSTSDASSEASKTVTPLKPLIIPSDESKKTNKPKDLMNYVIKKKPHSNTIKMFPCMSNSQDESIKNSKDTPTSVKKKVRPFLKTSEGLAKASPKKTIGVDKVPLNGKTLKTSIDTRKLQTAKSKTLKAKSKTIMTDTVNSVNASSPLNSVKTSSVDTSKAGSLISERKSTVCLAKPDHLSTNKSELVKIKSKSNPLSSKPAPKSRRIIEEEQEEDLLNEDVESTGESDDLDEDKLLNDATSESTSFFFITHLFVFFKAVKDAHSNRTI